VKKLRCSFLISESNESLVPPLSQFDTFGDTVDELFDNMYDLSLNTIVRDNISKIVNDQLEG